MITDLIGSGIVPYFKVTNLSTNSTLDERDLSTFVQSFSVSEKEREFMTGTLSVIDTSGLYAKSFRYGASIQVEWGLKHQPTLIKTFPKEADGQYSRGPIKCMVLGTNISLQNGICVLNVQFRIGNAFDVRKQTVTYKSGTIKQMIEAVCATMQADSYINFDRMTENLSATNQFVQNDETPIAFLHRLAGQFNVKLCYNTYAQTPAAVLSTNPKICKVYMIDWAKQNTISFVQDRGLSGQYHYFDYGSQYANMKSGSFDTNNNAAGGSSVSVVNGPNGQPQIIRKPSESDQAEVYELNPDAIRAFLKDKPMADAARYTQEIIASAYTDFETNFQTYVKLRFFVAKGVTTAPEGYGYTGKASVVPNPLYQIGDTVWVGPQDGSAASLIPAIFRTNASNSAVQYRTLWRITELSQKIDGGGYSMDVSLAR